MVRPPQPFNPVLVMLAAAAALFFVLPLTGLVARAPWASAAGLLTDPQVLLALRL